MRPAQLDTGLTVTSREAMRNLSATRYPVKACLSPSLLHPPTVSSTNTCLSPHLTCIPLRLSFASVHRTFALSSRSFQQPIRRTGLDREPKEKTEPSANKKLHAVRTERIWTIPNILTISRILSCPALGYAILHDSFYVATGLLLYAGLTDLVRPRFLLPVTNSCLFSTGSGRWLLGAEVRYGFGPRLDPRSGGRQGVDDYPGCNAYCKRIGSLYVHARLKSALPY